MARGILILLITTGLWAQTGAKYLIITHDNFYEAIKPLAEWKHKKGMPTKIVRLSEIGATPESLVRVKNYIVNAYNTWHPRPEYILLVGAPEYLRSDQNYFDDYFGNTVGNYLMELSVGRFSCRTPLECSLLVAKTLGYERTPYLTDTLWYKKGTHIVREDYASSDTVYWQNIRYISELWQNAGYIHIDSFSRARGDSARHVEEAITNGRAFVVFRGQGVNNWWAPFAINPESTTNGYKLPVIVSGTCATMSLEPNLTYLGERAVRSGTPLQPKGAVAFVGTTNSTSGTGIAVLRGTVVTSFFKAIFEEGNYKLGDALKRAKFLLDSLSPSGYTSTRYREWNLLGDPELNLWTQVPKSFVVIYDSVIPIGQQNYQVTVTHGALPVQNALVCIMQDTMIYQYGYTNFSGTVTFSINPQITGLMTITVTKPNFHPYEGIIRITGSGINQISNCKGARSNLKIYPNPTTENLFLKNLDDNEAQIKIYDPLGRKVLEGVIKKSSPLINLKNLKPGVYLLEVKSSSKTLLNKITKKK
jgi:hypothetical protein